MIMGEKKRIKNGRLIADNSPPSVSTYLRAGCNKSGKTQQAYMICHLPHRSSHQLSIHPCSKSPEARQTHTAHFLPVESTSQRQLEVQIQNYCLKSCF